jgi:hypothetical protein
MMKLVLILLLMFNIGTSEGATCDEYVAALAQYDIHLNGRKVSQI